MDRMQKLRESLQHALVKAQRATEEGIKHQFVEIGDDLIRLGREMKKRGGVKMPKVARKIAAKRPAAPTLHV